mmetsp:Transcript_75535/g.208396  ORF Transcript_75535/g.208396 Transcript_75535/m.208396 type:complete len:303 (-) Transcript_75535:2112-3020(-)
MWGPSVMAVSLTTTMYSVSSFARRSRERPSSPFSQRPGKASVSSSAGSRTVSTGLSSSSSSSAVSPTFKGLITLSAASKYARKSSLSMTPSPPTSICKKTSSEERSPTCWWCLASLSDAARTLSMSSIFFFRASSRNCPNKCAVLLILPSIRPRRELCFLVSLSIKARTASLKPSSMSAFSPSILSFAVPTLSFAAPMSSSIWSARTTISEASMALPLVDAGFTLSSTLLMAWSASATASVARLILSCISALISSSLFSMACLCTRRTWSRCSSRSTPTAIFTSWKVPNWTPRSPCLAEYSE